MLSIDYSFVKPRNAAKRAVNGTADDDYRRQEKEGADLLG
jgi:hypothetical protein